MPLLEKLGLKEKPGKPQETISKLLGALNALELGDRDSERNLANVARYLSFLKFHLFGDQEHEVTKEQVLELSRELMHTDLLYLLVKHLALLDFESRKDAAQCFGATVRIRDSEDRSPGAQYVLQHPYIISKLFHGYVLTWDSQLHRVLLCLHVIMRRFWHSCCRYDEPAIALNCGSMLRDCIRDESLAK
jgi:calcium binding protein 39